MYKNVVNVLKITRETIENYIEEEMTVVDFTMGNGNDTLLIAKALNGTGKIYGFDLQKIAVDKTKEKLNKAGMDFSNIEFINDGHENVNLYIDEKIDFGIYNLGYLPSGDKSIITLGETTLISIKKTLELLKENGILVIVSYIGHHGGMEENNLIVDYLGKLNQKEFNVLKYEFVNQLNNPPKVYIVEKSK